MPLLVLLLASLPWSPLPASDRVEPGSTCLCAVSDASGCLPDGTCVCITADGWVALSLGSEEELCEEPRAELAPGLSGRDREAPVRR